MKIYRNGSRYSVELYGNYVPITIETIEYIIDKLSQQVEFKKEYDDQLNRYLTFGMKIKNPKIIWNEGVL